MQVRFKYLSGKHASWVARNQHVYPKEMQEPNENWERIINSTPYSVGITIDNILIGWRIFEREYAKVIYGSDLTILPEYQRKGFAKQLVEFSLVAPLRAGEIIHSHLRYTSYGIIANRKRCFDAGYEIFSEKYRLDFYGEWYGIHESAIEVWMRPLRLPATGNELSQRLALRWLRFFVG